MRQLQEVDLSDNPQLRRDELNVTITEICQSAELRSLRLANTNITSLAGLLNSLRDTGTLFAISPLFSRCSDCMGTLLWSEFPMHRLHPTAWNCECEGCAIADENHLVPARACLRRGATPLPQHLHLPWIWRDLGTHSLLGEQSFWRIVRGGAFSGQHSNHSTTAQQLSHQQTGNVLHDIQ